MVELENYRVALAAVDARVLRQVPPHPELVFVSCFVASFSNTFDVFFAISLVPSVLVVNKTALAPGVADAQLRIPEAELINRFFDAASSARFGL